MGLAVLFLKKEVELMTEFYSMSEQQVLEQLKTDRNGLHSNVAAERLAKNGANKLAEPPKRTIWQMLFDSIKAPMTLVLLAAAVISLVVSLLSGGGFDFDVIVILAVVVLNSVIEVVQETNADKALEALKEMTRSKCRVIRDGKDIIIDNQDLVVGDIIRLEAGDAIPADARIIECAAFKTEESALTGESLPVQKTHAAIEASGAAVPLGDRKNMVYMGSTCVYGRALAVVAATGMQTEMGKIAKVLSQAEQEETPLQLKLAQLSRILTIAVLAICVFIFGFNCISGMIGGGEILKIAADSLLIAVSLAVAAIPEGLSAVVTILLSIGVSRMAKQNAVVRRLSAVETLGCTQIICSDKTGTLTQNKMTVVDSSAASVQLLSAAMALCSDATVDEKGEVTGEPTEAALVTFAYKNDVKKYEIERDMPRVAEAPFDSERKMMSTFHSFEGRVMQYTKGAPDELLSRCSRLQTESGSVELTDELRKKILGVNGEMADRALRVLGAAFKTYDSVPEFDSPSQIECDMTFIGLCGMIDPIRPEVKAAVADCRSAGIRPVMITGDHAATAAAIGIELGIITDRSQAITGAELDKMSDEYLDEHIGDYSVYARVQPEHKVRIVSAWKKAGKVVAMTGDGVNDAPSIKTADIGIGMGITGTDVTKGAADMILADDNFATIVSAVQEGRRIYDNIRKAIQFLLSSNLSEVISIFITTVCGLTIFQPLHILWINLITDSLPALALGMEEAESDIMSLKPREKSEGIFAGHVGIATAFEGVCISALTLAAFFIGRAYDLEAGSLQTLTGTTMAFMTMSLCECIHAFNLRSMRHSAFKMKKQNKWLWLSAAASLVLTMAVILIAPVRDLFGFVLPDLEHLLISLGLALLILPLVEVSKLIIGKK